MPIRSPEAARPQFVLFGDSITEQSFRHGGWGASLANTYSRKVPLFFFTIFLVNAILLLRVFCLDQIVKFTKFFIFLKNLCLEMR